MYVQCTYISAHVTCVVLRSEVNKSGITGSATAKKTVKKTQPIGDKPALDFFGRRVKSGTKGAGVASSHTQHPLWFRFNEGFSNAVRRPVRMQDLL
jgi:hypothetical protein